MSDLPHQYDPQEREAHWARRWEEQGLYHYAGGRNREETFVVDTPPPTVSGALHVGHVFSYTQQDLIVRQQRMLGKSIAYPMGWDDNGLPTERRVQNLFAIKCNPRLPYDEEFRPEESRGEGPPREVSRRNFIEACIEVTRRDEAAFEALWRRLGLSVDWNLQYSTIDDHCRRISQLSFLELLGRGCIYQAEAPTLWDVEFQTAVAQAEVEDRLQTGAFHDLEFQVEGGGHFVITTTRPELLPACIAVAAHPEDERYQELFGQNAVTPLFGARVPILPSPHADPEKGTGILMVCTFGDATDVEFWKRSGLPAKPILSRAGRLLPLDFGSEPFLSLSPEVARKAYAELEGLTVRQARSAIVGLLARARTPRQTSPLVNPPREVVHPVKFYEKGDRPLELIQTRQWFVDILSHRERLLELGRSIGWYPESMRNRYEAWVQGLNQDWCISRQRYFGVPFPVWYRLDDQGRVLYQNPILADPARLSVDPMSSVPSGYSEEQRDQPGGFTGEPDVLDTWATSSLTPQILSHWKLDPERHARLFPADIRPQSHEIIRTWAFYTMVKGLLHEDQVPFRHVLVSGWILDPDRKKMSKSQGNVTTPAHLLDRYGADGVRYWAARARLGSDTTFDESVMKQGKRLANKLFHAGRLVASLPTGISAGASALSGAQGLSPGPGGPGAHPLDRSLLMGLRELVLANTSAYAQFDYAGALAASERSFWEFCDNYLELVKARAYADPPGPAGDSARATLHIALRLYLRLFAPALPFVSEEVWSWLAPDSIHTAPWPSPDEPCFRELPGAAGTGRPGATGLPVAAGQEPPESAGQDRLRGGARQDRPSAAGATPTLTGGPAPDPLAALYPRVVELLGRVRRCKTENQRSLRWPVERLEIRGPQADLDALQPALADLTAAAALQPGGLVLEVGDPPEGQAFGVWIRLAETAPQPT